MSGGAFLSSSWYRVADLKPALKVNAPIRRHRFRGVPWYVVQDPASGRFNRFTPATYQLMALMDGRRRVEEIWSAVVAELGDDAPSQDEVIRVLSQLHGADLLYCDVNPDAAELFERYERHDKTRRRSYFKNPFSIRFPLWNPDAFLERTMRWIKPLWSWAGVALSCLLVGGGLLLAALHWPELTENIVDRTLATENLVMLWLVFPLVKLLHELGHAYATKAGGGEVHEMGVLFLVFTPVPYVDATASNGFRSKWSRALVGAAGMLVELAIAAIAMVVWVLVEPGLTRSIAFNVILIAGVSTVVFNANPLLRFDGYYILSDLIEIPNLAARGTQYWRYLAERYLFRMKDAEPPLSTPGERRWFLFYAPAALAYRLFVLVAIVLYVATMWFFIGIALAIWGIVTMFVLPVAKAVGYLTAMPRSQGARDRAISTAVALAAVVLAFLLLAPVPHRIRTEGVVWLPEDANVRAGTDGHVKRVLWKPGAIVNAGEPLIESEDPVLAAELEVIEARMMELEAKLSQELFADRVQAEVTRQQLDFERARLERSVERMERLVAKSRVQGRFVVDRPEDLIGRYHRQGDSLGHVIHPSPTIVRTVVSQDDVDLVRTRLVDVDVRLAESVETVRNARLVREVPAAGERLPSTALTTAGGGELAADPRDARGDKGLASTFQFDLELPAGVGSGAYGGRAYVRFDLAPEPLAYQWYRRLRQTLLSQLHV